MIRYVERPVAGSRNWRRDLTTTLWPIYGGCAMDRGKRGPRQRAFFSGRKSRDDAAALADYSTLKLTAGAVGARSLFFFQASRIALTTGAA